MSNAASTPEFTKILKSVYHSGQVRTSGEALSEAWKIYHFRYPSPSEKIAPGPQYHERSGPEQRKRMAIKATFRNPEMRPRIKVVKRRRRGKLGTKSPLKGFRINARKKKTKHICADCGAPMSILSGPCKVCGSKQIVHKKNPIAIYNPKNGVKLPASKIEIRYRRVGGRYNGQWFRHEFKSSVALIGMSDGNILIKSISGRKLWGAV
jgi:ribosomal protein L40E